MWGSDRQCGYEGRVWVAYFWFVGWDCLSFGLHVCLGAPNIEIHIPFGFIRLGRRSEYARREDCPWRGWSFFSPITTESVKWLARNLASGFPAGNASASSSSPPTAITTPQR